MWQYNHTNELCHHGILGMKWGKRNESEKLNPHYTKTNQNIDKVIYGKSGVRRISKRMDKGHTYTKAQKIKDGRQFLESTLLSVGTSALIGYMMKTSINNMQQAGKQAANASLAKIGMETYKTLKPWEYKVMVS